MICSVIMAFTEAALEIATVLGLDGGLGGVGWIDGGRRVIEHGGGGAFEGEQDKAEVLAEINKMERWREEQLLNDEEGKKRKGGERRKNPG